MLSNVYPSWKRETCEWMVCCFTHTQSKETSNTPKACTYVRTKWRIGTVITLWRDETRLNVAISTPQVEDFYSSEWSHDKKCLRVDQQIYLVLQSKMATKEMCRISSHFCHWHRPESDRSDSLVFKDCLLVKVDKFDEHAVNFLTLEVTKLHPARTPICEDTDIFRKCVKLHECTSRRVKDVMRSGQTLWKSLKFFY